MPDMIILPRFNDMHCHFRTGKLLEEVLPQTVRYAGRGVAMPNTKPQPILTARDVICYQAQIRQVLEIMPVKYQFDPLMTIEIRDNTTPEIVEQAFKAGAIAGKVYPKDVYSKDGLSDFFSATIAKTFRAMEEIGMILLIHGELNQTGVLVTRREEVFLTTLALLAQDFNSLRIVLEHVSSKAGVEMVKTLGKNVAATITAHHLCLTLNNVIGDGIRPHNACNPMPKDFHDRDALIEAAIGRNPKFFLGSDTAPHLRQDKECAKGACGVYSAPVLPQVLVEVFEEAGAPDRLENFTSGFGAQFYGLEPNKGTVTLVKKEWTVPEQIGSVVPFMAGQKLSWQIV